MSEKMETFFELKIVLEMKGKGSSQIPSVCPTGISTVTRSAGDRQGD